MNKRTFTVYGFLIVVAIVVGLMITLATPFGQHILDGIKNILSSLDPRVDSIDPILQGSGNGF